MSDAVEPAAAATPQAAAASSPGGARTTRPVPAPHPVTRWIVRPTLAGVVAVGSVLAAASAAWTVAWATAWSLQQVTVSDQVAQTSGAYLALVVIGGAAVLGTTGGRRLRYYRAERRAERARWEAAQPEFTAALHAKRAERPKKPSRALPRPVGLPIS